MPVTTTTSMVPTLLSLVFIFSGIIFAIILGTRLGAIFPQTVFGCRGSHGVAKGPLDHLSVRSRCRRVISIVIYVNTIL